MTDIDMGDKFVRQLQTTSPMGVPTPTKRPRRTLAPPNPEWPELDFLEEKSQSAFESERDALWLENNADFLYCDMHQQVCEMIASHPDEWYNPDCQKCLKPVKGGLMQMFFHSEGADLDISQARQAWFSYHNRRKEVHAQLSTAPVSNRELQKQFDFRERAAFIRYMFLAWQQNRLRVAAIREHAKNPGQSAAYNMMPNIADEHLSNFVKDAELRNRQTGSGLQGRPCNVKLCDVHEGGKGHYIHAFNKYRYHECGICVRTREESHIQRAADRYDSSAPTEERPRFHFDTTKKTTGWRAPKQGE